MEYCTVNEVNWQQVSIITGYKKSILERSFRSKDGFIILLNLGISSYTVHNTIRRFGESGEIFVHKGQGLKSSLIGCEFRALRRHCIKNRHYSVVEIIARAQEHL